MTFRSLCMLQNHHFYSVLKSFKKWKDAYQTFLPSLQVRRLFTGNFSKMTLIWRILFSVEDVETKPQSKPLARLKILCSSRKKEGTKLFGKVDVLSKLMFLKKKVWREDLEIRSAQQHCAPLRKKRLCKKKNMALLSGKLWLCWSSLFIIKTWI